MSAVATIMAMIAEPATVSLWDQGDIQTARIPAGFSGFAYQISFN
jgi:hypothetical protein